MTKSDYKRVLVKWANEDIARWDTYLGLSQGLGCFASHFSKEDLNNIMKYLLDYFEIPSDELDLKWQKYLHKHGGKR